MKHTLLFCLLIGYGIIASAQMYDSAVRYGMTSPTFSVASDTLIQRALSANPSDSDEGSSANQLLRYKEFMGSRISNDVAVGGDMYAPIEIALGSYMVTSGGGSGGGCGGNWKNIGPFTSSYGGTGVYGTPGAIFEQQGRIISLWVNPVYPNVILAGSDAGGLWKSTDDGLHWHNISDGNVIPGTMGVKCIAVDPLDTNIIYVALSIDGQYGKSTGYYLGLAYTTDGGAHWQTDDAFNGVVTGGTPVACSLLQIKNDANRESPTTVARLPISDWRIGEYCTNFAKDIYPQ